MKLTTEIIYLIIVAAEFLMLVVPLIVGLVAAIKKKAKAIKDQCEAINEKEAAEAKQRLLEAEKDIQEQKKKLIEETEALYKTVGDTMKEAGLNTAALKKEMVMSKLQSYALGKQYSFDYDYYSNEVEEDIAHTKKVNFK